MHGGIFAVCVVFAFGVMGAALCCRPGRLDIGGVLGVWCVLVDCGNVGGADEGVATYLLIWCLFDLVGIGFDVLCRVVRGLLCT